LPWGESFRQNLGRIAPRGANARLEIEPRLCEEPTGRNDDLGLLEKLKSVAIHCVQTRHTPNRHRPRKRAIQYSEAPVMETEKRR
jgi:hypothetical protein